MAPSIPNDPLMIFDRSYPATFLTTCPPALAISPVHRRDLDADDEIARRAEAMALRAAVVGGQQTADRGGLGERRIEREPLAARRSSRVDVAQPGAGLDAHREVAGPVVEDAVDARHVEEDVEGRAAPRPKPNFVPPPRTTTDSERWRPTAASPQPPRELRFDDVAARRRRRHAIGRTSTPAPRRPAPAIAPGSVTAQ